MAEERVNLPLTPRQINLDERKSGKGSVEERISLIHHNSSAPHYHEASTGSSHDGASSGRKSFGKPSLSNNIRDVEPRYLRAPMGSCHDLCKYGKHTFEEKSRLPLSKRIVKPLPYLPFPGGSSVPPGRYKVAMAKRISRRGTRSHPEKHRSLPDSKTFSCNPPEIAKRELSLPSKKIEAYPELATEKKMKKTLKESENISLKHPPLLQPKAAIVKASPSSNTSKGGTERRRRNSVINDGKIMVGCKNSLKEVWGPADSSPSKIFSKTMSSRSGNNRNLNLVAPPRDQNWIKRAATMNHKNEKVPEKTLHVVRTETVSDLFKSTENGNESSSLPTPSDQSPKSFSHLCFSSSSHEEDELHVVKTVIVSNVRESVQNGDVTSLPTPSEQSPKPLSHQHISLSCHEDELHVVKIEAVSNPFESVQNGDTAAQIPTSSDELPKPLSDPHEEDVGKGEDKTWHINGEANELIQEEEEDKTGHTNYEATEPTGNNEKATLNGKKRLEEEEEEEEEEEKEREETRHTNDRASELAEEEEEGKETRHVNNGASELIEEEEEDDDTGKETRHTNNGASELTEEEEEEEGEETRHDNSGAIELAEEEDTEVEETRHTIIGACELTKEEEEEEETGHTNYEATELMHNTGEANLDEKDRMVNNCSGTLKKDKGVVSENKDSSPVKLKFRRGKVVELQPDDNTPRRLKFRRGRVFGANSDEMTDARRTFIEEENEEEETGHTDYEATELIDNNGETNLNKKDPVVHNYSGTPRKGSSVFVEKKDSSPVKLKFRRGKFVELQHEDNIPRRLKFRRARVLGGNSDEKVDASIRNFKKRVVNDEANPSAEMVALKHQNVLDNKGTRGLFNNVIEKTANKLVERRKGKVGALVGAFETVISLQEREPSSDVVS